MRSRRTRRFKELFATLPASVKVQAEEAYRRFATNPQHPSLQFKCIDPQEPPLYFARVNRRYRVLGFLQGDVVTWIWIGPHSEYDKIT